MTLQATAPATRFCPQTLPYELLTATQSATKKESYTYDTVGNRTSQPGVPYTYNSSNEMLKRETQRPAVA
jgi:hypothetical protein